MSYQKRVFIFLTTMTATAILLIVFFVHSILRQVNSLDASSIPLPALDTRDKQEIRDLLQVPKNTGNAAPKNQNTNNAAPPAQQPSDAQNPVPEIPAKAMQ